MDRLLELLSEVRDDIDFEMCDDLIDGKVLTSFDIIQIIAVIDDEYDIDIPAAKIVPENFNSAEAIYELIKSLNGKNV